MQMRHSKGITLIASFPSPRWSTPSCDRVFPARPRRRSRSSCSRRPWCVSPSWRRSSSCPSWSAASAGWRCGCSQRNSAARLLTQRRIERWDGARARVVGERRHAGLLALLAPHRDPRAEARGDHLARDALHDELFVTPYREGARAEDALATVQGASSCTTAAARRGPTWCRPRSPPSSPRSPKPTATPTPRRRPGGLPGQDTPLAPDGPPPAGRGGRRPGRRGARGRGVGDRGGERRAVGSFRNRCRTGTPRRTRSSTLPTTA